MKILPTVEPRGLTMRQAAAYWGVSYGTFRKLVKQGLITPVDIGVGRMIFDREDLDRAFHRRRAA